jgi:hypothetical protein
MATAQSGERSNPLKKPPGHKPPVPRWTLKLPDDASHVYTLYIGVQCHGAQKDIPKRIEDKVAIVLSESAAAVDVLRVTDGYDVAHTKVWVAYFTIEQHFRTTIEKLNLVRLWNELGPDNSQIGLWTESFTAPTSRLETNYARLDHNPGLSQVPNVEQPAHELTAYWGAGRDRIPASAHDLFPTTEDIHTPATVPKGLGQRLRGSNYDNMCHIRSGQWWEQCDDEERIAYEQNLQEALMQGMQYLWEHPEETGTLGLRFLQNLNAEGQPIRETCGAGFFRNWADLERWSSRHPSHLKIFNGALWHAKQFGDERKFMTWHEVWILKRGEVQFDYVNCDPRTGVIKRVELEAEALEE